MGFSFECIKIIPIPPSFKSIKLLKPIPKSDFFKRCIFFSILISWKKVILVTTRILMRRIYKNPESRMKTFTIIRLALSTQKLRESFTLTYYLLQPGVLNLDFKFYRILQRGKKISNHHRITTEFWNMAPIAFIASF